ncbi:MAG: winged helix-turn-helix domain-containing protein [Edaphobacter sp.]|uniref:winged helix-turn-helix domain-containing tetratricopeptide repeat protein n=1 Tax=Edaphobacter sp. TaxID=1934404 RepID=UPI002399F434|nr:winged helix-turn-helix domain-containing protein [Edaphobacter sp.]MDE1175673.1 winged helix-turn-helix domain-containing protein [Edaphobacter sp.]
MTDSASIRFLDFELDRNTFSLRRGDTPVRLDPKPLELLFLLAERKGALVTHDEALARVWGEGVYVDGESALYTAIKKIRRALGDHTLVLTVSGRGYRLNLPPASATLLAVPETVQRLAVLPLANLNPDPAEDYFSDGLTEELIATMARLFGARLGIIARTSVMRFKGTSLPIETIARDLAVDYLIEGSVRRNDNRVRIAVKLLRASDSTALWTQTFERNLTDLFQLQSEIALATAHAVQTRLTHTLPSSPALNPEVHDLLLRARHLWVQRTRPTIEAAMGYFRQALTLDPACAPAYAGLASCYAILPITSNARPSDCFPLAQQFAEQALAIQTGSQAQPEAHMALGLVQFWYWRNWQLAVHHFQQIELLNPSDSNGPMFLAHVHSILQQHDQAIATIHRARHLDPLSPIVNTHIGHFLYNAGRFQQALSPLDRILELVPQFWVAHLMCGKALGLLEQPEAAIESFSKALSFSSGNTEPLAFRAYTFASTGHREAALADLAALEHQRISAFSSPVHLALAHLGLGNHSAALQLIDQAFEERDLRLIFLAVESRWLPLRNSGHFGPILMRAGLPNL